MEGGIDTWVSTTSEGGLMNGSIDFYRTWFSKKSTSIQSTHMEK